MGMTPQVFGELRPADYGAVAKAWVEAENSRLRYFGELARGHAARILNAFCKPKIKQLDKFWEMPWDKSHLPIPKISPDKRRAQIEKLLKLSEKHE